MATWQPTDTPNGWWPILSWPWVMFGTTEVRLHNLQTGANINLTRSPGRCYPAGWWTAGVECVYSHAPAADGSGPQTCYRYNTLTGATTVVGTMPLGMNMVRASKGHWAYTVAGVGLWYDGVQISADTGWPLAQDGTYLAHSCNDGIHIWNGSTEIHLVPLLTANTRMSLKYPYLGYGYSQPHLVDLRTWVDTSVALSTQSEQFPVPVVASDGRLWIWTPAVMGTSSYVVGRVFGSSVLTRFPRVNATFVDAELAGSNWVVASSSDIGALVVEVFPAGTAGQPGPIMPPGPIDPSSQTTVPTAQYPPLSQPMLDMQTGIVTREWARWFLWVAQASQTNPYVDLATGVLLGRGSDTSGPAVAITLGPGLTMRENVLTLDP